MTNRFGIAVDNDNFIIDMKYFEPGDWNSKYFEISEFQFYYYLAIRTPYSKFLNGQLVNDPADATAYIAEKTRFELREQLERLHIKIGLAERMGEDPRPFTEEFDRLKIMYENL